MKALGKAYADAEASQGGDFPRLPAGGYVVVITSVKDMEQKEYLDVVFDIAEGQYKGFYGDTWGKEHPYAHHIIRSYKDTAAGMFKGFLAAVDDSNPGCSFVKQAEKGLQEQQLVGKIFGAVIGYEEYMTDRGEIRERSYVNQNRSAGSIRDGEYKVPELKKYKPKDAPTSAPAPIPGFENITDDDVPF